MRFLILQKGILYEVLLFLLKWNLLSKLLAIKCTIGVTLGHLQVVQTASFSTSRLSPYPRWTAYIVKHLTPHFCAPGDQQSAFQPWRFAWIFYVNEICIHIFTQDHVFKTYVSERLEGPSRGRISIIRFMKPNNAPPFGHTTIYSSSLLLIDMEVASVFWI